MKKIVCYLFPLLLLPFCSFNGKDLKGHPMPVLPNKTLDGKTIDRHYFQGHITLVTFMFIGCPGCMNEIGTLNKLQQAYSGTSRFQILCIARQMKDQMLQFNSDNNNGIYSSLRNVMNTPNIQYSIQPACPDAKSKADSDANNVTLRSECTDIENTYGITAFPTLYFVNSDGIITDISIGGPPTNDDPAFYNRLKAKVDSLLAM